MSPASWKTMTFTCLGACIAILGLFWQTTGSLVSIWYRSSTFVHGFFILPLCIYLVWSRRHQITPLVPTPRLAGFLLLTIIECGWLVGHLADVIVVQQITLVLMFQGLVWTVLGTEVIRALLFPLAFLFFAVPVGEFLIPYLQDCIAFW